MRISLHLEIYGAAYSLAYPAVSAAIVLEFPSVVFEEQWREVAEYDRLLDFLRTKDPQPEQRIADTMLAQMRSKQIAHGPTIGFRIPATEDTPEIDGRFHRWGIVFHSREPMPAILVGRIEALLSSFGIGTIEHDPEPASSIT